MHNFLDEFTDDIKTYSIDILTKLDISIKRFIWNKALEYVEPDMLMYKIYKHYFYFYETGEPIGDQTLLTYGNEPLQASSPSSTSSNNEDYMALMKVQDSSNKYTFDQFIKMAECIKLTPFTYNDCLKIIKFATRNEVEGGIEIERYFDIVDVAKKHFDFQIPNEYQEFFDDSDKYQSFFNAIDTLPDLTDDDKEELYNVIQDAVVCIYTSFKGSVYSTVDHLLHLVETETTLQGICQGEL